MRCDMHEPPTSANTVTITIAIENVFCYTPPRILLQMYTVYTPIMPHVLYKWKMLNINHQQNNKLNGILKKMENLLRRIHTYVYTYHILQCEKELALAYFCVQG